MARKKSDKKSLVKRLVLGIGAFYLLASLGAAWYFTTSWRLGGDFVLQDYQKLDVTTEDGVDLVARFFGSGERPVVIMAHDFHESAAQFKDLARQLSQSGYDIVVFDFRGHGNSASAHVGLGSTEIADVEAVIQAVKDEHSGRSVRMAWFGVGTGAAAFLMAPSATEMDCAVLVNCYDDLQQSFDHALRENLRVPLRPLCSLAIAMAEWRTGTKLDELRPIEQLVRLGDTPILFLHDNTHQETGERLRAAASGDSELYIHPVDDSDFRKMARDGAVGITINDFFKRWL